MRINFILFFQPEILSERANEKYEKRRDNVFNDDDEEEE